MFLCLLSRFILFLIGWDIIDSKTLHTLNLYPHTVLVFSHTSYFDFLYLILLKLSHPFGLSNLKTLVKPQPFKYFGWFLYPLGCIPAPKLQDKQAGTVEKIVSDLKSFQRVMFALSPKGTMAKSDWRKGYFYIAQQLNAPIIALGADYEKKRLCISKFYHINNSTLISDIEVKLKNELGNYVPLHPECEVMPIRPHNPSKVSMINLKRFVMFFLSALISYHLY